MPRRLSAALVLCACACLAVPVASSSASAASSCAAPAPLTFSPPTYVDRTRAGGEPLVATLPTGRLVYSAHAGTTHVFAPDALGASTPAFVEDYTNQTYVWTSDDQGRTWTFRPRTLPPDNAPATGFSDPEVAVDSAGAVYFSEINLANVAVSRSTDHGSTFALQSFAGAVLTDRQWMEADRPGELYFVANAFGGGTGTVPSPGLGHYIAKSTDGGATFTTNVPDTDGGDGIGDIRVDKRTGTVYETHHPSYGTGTGDLSMASFRKARSGDLTPTLSVIAKGVDSVSHWPAFDLDPSGDLYVVWDESGRGPRPAGVYYATSRDGARTWSAPLRLDSDDHTDIWPWLAVGDDGRVAVAWLEASTKLPDNDAETPGTHGWRLRAAATDSGLGCARSTRPAFTLATATKDPVHTGTICQGGTTCQATATDRRLGDYFSLDVDGTGRMYVGYADTRVPGAVSLPGFVRQAGGPSLLAPKAAGTVPTATTARPAAAVPAAAVPRTRPASSGSTLADTGSGTVLPTVGAGLLLLLALLARRRRDA